MDLKEAKISVMAPGSGSWQRVSYVEFTEILGVKGADISLHIPDVSSKKEKKCQK